MNRALFYPLIAALPIITIILMVLFNPFSSRIDCEDRNYQYGIVVDVSVTSNCHYYTNDYEFINEHWVILDDYCQCNKVYNSTIQLKPIKIIDLGGN